MLNQEDPRCVTYGKGRKKRYKRANWAEGDTASGQLDSLHATNLTEATKTFHSDSLEILEAPRSSRHEESLLACISLEHTLQNSGKEVYMLCIRSVNIFTFLSICYVHRVSRSVAHSLTTMKFFRAKLKRNFSQK